VNLPMFSTLNSQPTTLNMHIRSKQHQCPCCDYFTLDERGQYDVCPVCYWEDSGADLDRLDEHSGPNHQTLREGRKHFLEFGACDRAMLVHVLPKEQRRQYKHQPRNPV
jgi:hypothetical protein